jgi:hypothetical protein
MRQSVTVMWEQSKSRFEGIVSASKRLNKRIADRRIIRFAGKQVASFGYHTDDFSKHQKGFLDRWLSSYIELDMGRTPDPESKIEKNILDMLEGRLPVDTIGMETYVKWQAAKFRFENPNDGSPSGSAFAGLQLSLNAMGIQFANLKARATADATALLAVMLSSDLSGSISAWTERVFDSAATIYDKAADAAYNAAHEGGALHRFFDGSHTVGGMWDAVKDASPDDSLAQEVAGFVDAFLKDVSTINGQPFFTISPESYNALADILNQSLGIPKAWTADIASFNMAELFGTSLGVIALALNWNKADREQFADYAAGLGIAAGFSANPLLGIVALVGLAKALEGKKDKVAYTQLLKGIGRGGVGTGVLLMAATVIGGPAWIGVIVGLILAVYARKTLGDMSAEFVAKWMSSALSAAYHNVMEGAQSVRGVFSKFGGRTPQVPCAP